jgi:hypothetical protein
MKELTDDEFHSLPQFFTNITSYGHTPMSPIRLASSYRGLNLIFKDRFDYNFSLKEGTPLYGAFQKILSKSVLLEKYHILTKLRVAPVPRETQ